MESTTIRRRMTLMAWAAVGVALTVGNGELRGDGVAYRWAVTSEPSLIGYYPFNADFGPVVNDVHAWGEPTRSHDGVLAGDATFHPIIANDLRDTWENTGMNGGQALEPGAGRVDLGSVPAYEFVGGTGTVEVLLYQSQETPGVNPCFFSCRDGTRTRYSLHGDSQGKRLWFWNGTEVLLFELPSPGQTMIGRWVHVAFVFNAGTVTAYLDGESLGTQAAGLGENYGLPVQIGASDPNNAEPWPGWIDELAIYDAALDSIVNHWMEFSRPFEIGHLLFDRLENTEPRYAYSLGTNDAAADIGNVDGGQKWWTWQAPADGWVLATADGTECVGVDLLVEEVDPADFFTATRVWSNSGSAHYGGRGRSAALFHAYQGRIYRLAVEQGDYSFPRSYPGTGCDFDFEDDHYSAHQCRVRVERLERPANDDRANAELVRGEFPSVQASNWGATGELDDPDGIEGLTGATVWWRWQAPTTREVTLSTLGSDIHTFLTVSESDDLGLWTPVAANQLAAELEPATYFEPFEIVQTLSPPSFPFPLADVLRRTSRVRFQAREGAEYLIGVDGMRFADGAEGMGNVRLNWEGITLEAFQEIQVRTNRDLSLAIQGEVVLSNRGIADADNLRMRVVGTRLYPGTARSRDPGRQESPELGRDLVAEPYIAIGSLGLGESTSVTVEFSIPAPHSGLVSVPDPIERCRAYFDVDEDDLNPPDTLAAIAARLKVAERPFDAWLASQLSADTVAALANYLDASSDPIPLRPALVQDFNRIFRGPPIYELERFAGIELRGQTEGLLAYHPQEGEGLWRLNQMLIEDAFVEAEFWRFSHEFCHVDWTTSTGHAYAWRAGVTIEVEAGALGWLPVVYYPLRHGPWPRGPIRLLDGSGPYGGPGDTGAQTTARYHYALSINSPESIVGGASTQLDATFEVYKDQTLRGTNNVSTELRLRLISGPGQAGPGGLIEALPTLGRTNLVLEGSYVWKDGKEYVAPSNIVIEVIPPPRNDQSIDFEYLYDQSYGDPPVVLAAASTSGLPVRFEVVSGPATLIDATTLELTGVGSVTVRAEQEGDTWWNAAPPVEQTFEVGKGQQTIEFAELADRLLTAAPVTLRATATSGLAVRFEVVSGPAELSGGVYLTMSGVGSVTVRAEQSGDLLWDAAPPVEWTFQVIDPEQARPEIVEWSPEGEAGDERLRVTVVAQAGWAVQLEGKVELGHGMPWSAVDEERTSDGGPMVFEAPIESGFRFFRLVARFGGD